ncbi:MAG: NYN domain-containing protein [Cyanobacteria bacterium P01_A01_bin.135]
MTVGFNSSQPSALAKLTANPTVLKIIKPALVGALVGGVSGSPNLGALSASATVGLGLLDPNYARRSEMLKLHNQQANLLEATEAQLGAVRLELAQFKQAVYPRGRVMVFVDGSNLYYSAREQNKGRLDYDKLFTCFRHGASAVSKVLYFTGVDRSNSGMSGFLDYLRRLNQPLEIVSKPVVRGENNELREKGIDTEIVLKMMEFAKDYDTAVLVTGDGDMLGAVQRVQQQHRRVEVASFPQNVSRVLREAADEFVDIGQLEVFEA